MLATGTDKESFTQDVLLKVNENDDVQFYWALLSQEIEDPHDSEELLNETVGDSERIFDNSILDGII